MALSIFLAKFLGIYFLVFAAIWVLRKEQFEAAIQDFLSSRGFIVFAGIFSFLFGLAIAISHSVWEWNWRGLITLIAYLAIIKGIIRIAFPRESQEYESSLVTNYSWVWIGILVVLGVFLTYHGFNVDHKPNFWGSIF